MTPAQECVALYDLSTVSCGKSLPDVGKVVSSRFSRISCRGTSRSAALDFSKRTLLGLMLIMIWLQAILTINKKRSTLSPGGTEELAQLWFIL